MRHSISDMARKAFLAIVALVVAGGLLALPAQSLAGQKFSADGYSYGELTTGTDGGELGWDEGVIVDATGVDEAEGDLETGSNALVSKVNDFSTTVGAVATVAFIIVSLARFSGRGIWELVVGDQSLTPPFLLRTREEGGGGKGRGGARSSSGNGWVPTMMKETIVFGCVILGIWIIIGLITGVVGLFFTDAVKPVQNNSGMNEFSLGGIKIGL